MPLTSEEHVSIQCSWRQKKTVSVPEDDVSIQCSWRQENTVSVPNVLDVRRTRRRAQRSWRQNKTMRGQSLVPSTSLEEDWHQPSNVFGVTGDTNLPTSLASQATSVFQCLWRHRNNMVVAHTAFEEEGDASLTDSQRLPHCNASFLLTSLRLTTPSLSLSNASLYQSSLSSKKLKSMSAQRQKNHFDCWIEFQPYTKQPLES